jgi:2-methylcitrate dehydratase PrpD
MTALQQLGEFVAESPAPPPRMREKLALHIADTVGAWLAGMGTPEGAALLRWQRSLREGAAAGTMQGLRLDVATHCALARLSEIDDIHLASTTTPGALVIPAAIATAAAVSGCDAAALAAAIIAGYEIMIRLGEAMGGPALLQRGIWPTYVTAPAGVAAVAARILGLDARQATNALALALTRSAPGVGHHNAATTARWLAVGQAAETGLTAALAARAGFTADLGLLDGAFLSAIYGIELNPAVLTAGLGEQTRLGEVSFKPWCAARQTMAATQALLEIVEAGVAPGAVVQVKAFVLPPHRRMIDHGVTAGDRSSYLTSLPYRMAVALLAPQDALDVRAPDEVPPELRAFMDRIAVEPDESLLQNYPREWPARVEVTTATGSHERTVAHVPGDPARPLDAASVKDKFQRGAMPATAAKAAARLFQQALGLAEGKTSASGLLAAITESSEFPSPGR